MFVDHVGVLILLVSVIASTTLWLGVRGIGRSAGEDRKGAPADRTAEDEAERVEPYSVPVHFLGTLLLFIVWQAVALLLVLWALAFREVGFTVAVLLLLPVLVGFGQAWRKGALRW